MPKGRKPWSTTEESALSRGIKKHGLGQWKKIQDDGELFADGRSFTARGVRSNVDLKDKWRNMLKSKAPGGEAEEGTAPSRSDISPNITTTATSNSFRAGVTAKLPKATPMPSYEPQATSASLPSSMVAASTSAERMHARDRAAIDDDQVAPTNSVVWAGKKLSPAFASVSSSSSDPPIRKRRHLSSSSSTPASPCSSPSSTTPLSLGTTILSVDEMLPIFRPRKKAKNDSAPYAKANSTSNDTRSHFGQHARKLLVGPGSFAKASASSKAPRLWKSIGTRCRTSGFSVFSGANVEEKQQLYGIGAKATGKVAVPSTPEEHTRKDKVPKVYSHALRRAIISSQINYDAECLERESEYEERMTKLQKQIGNLEKLKATLQSESERKENETMTQENRDQVTRTLQNGQKEINRLQGMLSVVHGKCLIEPLCRALMKSQADHPNDMEHENRTLLGYQECTKNLQQRIAKLDELKATLESRENESMTDENRKKVIKSLLKSQDEIDRLQSMLSVVHGKCLIEPLRRAINKSQDDYSKDTEREKRTLRGYLDCTRNLRKQIAYLEELKAILEAVIRISPFNVRKPAARTNTASHIPLMNTIKDNEIIDDEDGDGDNDSDDDDGSSMGGAEDDEEESEEEDEEADFDITFQYLKSLGWFYKRGNALYDFFYIRPGVQNAKKGVLGRDMFSSANDAINWAYRWGIDSTGLRTGHIDEDIPEGFNSPLGRGSSSSSSNPPSTGRKSRKERKKKVSTPEVSGYTAREKLIVQDHNSGLNSDVRKSGAAIIGQDGVDDGGVSGSDEVDNQEQEEEDVYVPLTWQALKADHGWFFKVTNKKYVLTSPWTYYRPGATFKTGKKDEHFFFTEGEAVAFAEVWCVGVDGRNGHVNESPPTSEHIKVRGSSDSSDDIGVVTVSDTENVNVDGTQNEMRSDSDDSESENWTWNELKKLGWHHSSSGQTLVDYFYMRPGVEKSGGRVVLPDGSDAILNYHYFHSEARAFGFCRSHQVDGNGRVGALDEPDVHLFRSRTKKIRVSGKRERKIINRFNPRRESLDSLPPTRGGYLPKNTGLSAQERKELREKERKLLHEQKVAEKLREREEREERKKAKALAKTQAQIAKAQERKERERAEEQRRQLKEEETKRKLQEVQKRKEETQRRKEEKEMEQQRKRQAKEAEIARKEAEAEAASKAKAAEKLQKQFCAVVNHTGNSDRVRRRQLQDLKNMGGSIEDLARNAANPEIAAAAADEVGTPSKAWNWKDVWKHLRKSHGWGYHRAPTSDLHALNNGGWYYVNGSSSKKPTDPTAILNVDFFVDSKKVMSFARQNGLYDLSSDEEDDDDEEAEDEDTIEDEQRESDTQITSQSSRGEIDLTSSVLSPSPTLTKKQPRSRELYEPSEMREARLKGTLTGGTTKRCKILRQASQSDRDEREKSDVAPWSEWHFHKLWQELKEKHDWFWVKGHGLVPFFYIRGGFEKTITKEKAQLNCAYFTQEEDVMAYCYKHQLYDPTTEENQVDAAPSQRSKLSSLSQVYTGSSSGLASADVQAATADWLWADVWAHIRFFGWKKHVNGVWIRPGGQYGTKNAVEGEDFFDSTDSVKSYLYLKGLYPPNGEDEYEDEDIEGGHDSPDDPSKQPRQKSKDPFAFETDDEDEDIEASTPIKFNCENESDLQVMWGQLRNFGWYHKPGGGDVAYYYYRPGSRTKGRGGIEGADYFLNLKQVQEFARRHKIDGKDRIGAISEQSETQLRISAAAAAAATATGATTSYSLSGAESSSAALVASGVVSQVGGVPFRRRDRRGPSQAASSFPSLAVSLSAASPDCNFSRIHGRGVQNPRNTGNSNPFASTSSDDAHLDPASCPWEPMWKELRDLDWQFRGKKSGFQLPPGDNKMRRSIGDTKDAVREYLGDYPALVTPFNALWETLEEVGWTLRPKKGLMASVNVYVVPGGHTGGRENYEWFRKKNEVRKRVMTYPELMEPWDWSRLRKLKWTYKKGGGLHSYTYLPPGGKTESEGGIEGKDYFRGEEAAFAFVCAHPELFREGTTLDDIKAQEFQTDDEDEESEDEDETNKGSGNRGSSSKSNNFNNEDVDSEANEASGTTAVRREISCDLDDDYDSDDDECSAGAKKKISGLKAAKAARARAKANASMPAPSPVSSITSVQDQAARERSNSICSADNFFDDLLMPPPTPQIATLASSAMHSSGYEYQSSSRVTSAGVNSSSSRVVSTISRDVEGDTNQRVYTSTGTLLLSAGSSTDGKCSLHEDVDTSCGDSVGDIKQSNRLAIEASTSDTRVMMDEAFGNASVSLLAGPQLSGATSETPSSRSVLFSRNSFNSREQTIPLNLNAGDSHLDEIVGTDTIIDANDALAVGEALGIEEENQSSAVSALPMSTRQSSMDTSESGSLDSNTALLSSESNDVVPRRHNFRSMPAQRLSLSDCLGNIETDGCDDYSSATSSALTSSSSSLSHQSTSAASSGDSKSSRERRRSRSGFVLVSKRSRSADLPGSSDLSTADPSSTIKRARRSITTTVENKEKKESHANNTKTEVDGGAHSKVIEARESRKKDTTAVISITIDDAISRLHNADAALQSTAIKGTSFEEANNATGNSSEDEDEIENNQNCGRENEIRTLKEFIKSFLRLTPAHPDYARPDRSVSSTGSTNATRKKRAAAVAATASQVKPLPPGTVSCENEKSRDAAIYICGKPGTGKTFSRARALEQIREICVPESSTSSSSFLRSKHMAAYELPIILDINATQFEHPKDLYKFLYHSVHPNPDYAPTNEGALDYLNAHFMCDGDVSAASSDSLSLTSSETPAMYRNSRSTRTPSSNQSSAATAAAGRARQVLLVIDEFDHLIRNNHRNHQEIVVNLLKWASASSRVFRSSSSGQISGVVQSPPLILVSIANSLELPDGVTKKLDAQEIRAPKHVAFKPYDASMLTRIVVSRVGQNLIKKNALELLTRRSEANETISGDVRRALNLVRRAVNQAEDDLIQKRQELVMRGKGSSRASALNAASDEEDDTSDNLVTLPIVTMKHMKEAFALIKGKGSTSKIDAIRGLTLHAQTLLVAAVMRASRNTESTSSGGSVSMSKIKDSFGKVQKQLSGGASERADVDLLIGQLDSVGLLSEISTSSKPKRDSLALRRRGNGKGSDASSHGNIHYKVNASVDDVREALKDSQPRLCKLTFKK